MTRHASFPTFTPINTASAVETALYSSQLYWEDGSHKHGVFQHDAALVENMAELDRQLLLLRSQNIGQPHFFHFKPSTRVVRWITFRSRTRSAAPSVRGPMPMP